MLHSPSHEINYISHHRLCRRYLAHTLGEVALLPTKRQHEMQKKTLGPTTDCLHLPFACGADCSEITLGIISMCICTCCIKCHLITPIHVRLPILKAHVTAITLKLSGKCHQGQLVCTVGAGGFAHLYFYSASFTCVQT